MSAQLAHVLAFRERRAHTVPMNDGKDNGKSPVPRPVAADLLGDLATIAERGADVRPKRPRAPRPPGSPVAIVKKGIG